MSLIFKKVSDSKHEIYWVSHPSGDEIKDGELLQDVDGYLYYWPEKRDGCIPACILRSIADKLDELNKDWHEHVMAGPTIS